MRYTNRPRVQIPKPSRFRVEQLRQLEGKQHKLPKQLQEWYQAVNTNNAPGQIVSCDESVLAEVEKATEVKIHRENVPGQSKPAMEPKPAAEDGSASA